MSTIGYKQVIVHTNDLPKIKTKIVNLSNICRYIDAKNKRNNQDRYYFDVTVNGGGLSSAYKHLYFLTHKDKEKINSLFDKIDKIKNVEEVILR